MHQARKALCTLLLTLSMSGCNPVSAPNQPPPPIATGYGSQADQTLGKSLAALRAFAASAKADYSTLTPSQQQEEKIPLNSFIMAVDAADQTYVAYHNGLTTLDQAQRSLAQAQSAQSEYTVVVAGVK